VSLLAVLALLTIASCVTPSVPIPPPSPERMVFEVDTDNGTATFEYDPDPSYAGAVVYVFNRNNGNGVINTAAMDGSVITDPFPAVEGDEVVISVETELQLASTCVVMRQGRSSSAFECNF
jgi:hypothetical protein